MPEPFQLPPQDPQVTTRQKVQVSGAVYIAISVREHWSASRPTKESAALLERISDAGRAEAQAAAQRLVDIGELFVLRCRDSGERDDWAMDTWEAVAAQVAAALRCSVAMGSSYLRYAMAVRNRLPQLGKAFQAGDIDYRLTGRRYCTDHAPMRTRFAGWTPD